MTDNLIGNPHINYLLPSSESLCYADEHGVQAPVTHRVIISRDITV
jgi:hypothetical protein